jgi:hypothetical protein
MHCVAKGLVVPVQMEKVSKQRTWTCLQLFQYWGSLLPYVMCPTWTNICNVKVCSSICVCPLLLFSDLKVCCSQALQRDLQPLQDVLAVADASEQRRSPNAQMKARSAAACVQQFLNNVAYGK